MGEGALPSQRRAGPVQRPGNVGGVRCGPRGILALPGQVGWRWFRSRATYVGIDLDGAFDRGTSCYVPWPRTLRAKFAKPEESLDPGVIVSRLVTYAEVSPSGTGVKAIVRATLPPGGRKVGGKDAGLEMYDSGRFFALTGHVAPAGQSVIAEAGAFVAELHAAVFGQRKAAQANHRPAGFQPSDDQVLDAIRRARNGGRLARLLAGNASGYSSPSEADAALACGLAFWTRDPDQIGRLMRQSGLIRDKYDRRDYLPRTIGRTLGQATESYDWGRRARIRPAIERAERIERAETTECDRGGNVPVVLSADPVESAIRDTLPKVVGRMSRQVFELARALKAIPTYSDAPAEAVRQHLKRWHRLGTEAGTVTDSFTDTWIAFAMGWPKVKFPLGADAMSTIVERARAAAVPKCAERYDSPHVSFLASLCRELQAEAGNKPFYLSCATAGRLLAVDATTAWRYLWLLQHDRIIEVVEKGHQGRATRFKYAGD